METLHVDNLLLSRLRNGEAKAFDALFRKYYPLLCAYGKRFISTENAEEIAQDALLWLWEHREEEIVQTSLAKYLLRYVVDFGNIVREPCYFALYDYDYRAYSCDYSREPQSAEDDSVGDSPAMCSRHRIGFLFFLRARQSAEASGRAKNLQTYNPSP